MGGITYARLQYYNWGVGGGRRGEAERVQISNRTPQRIQYTSSWDLRFHIWETVRKINTFKKKKKARPPSSQLSSEQPAASRDRYLIARGAFALFLPPRPLSSLSRVSLRLVANSSTVKSTCDENNAQSAACQPQKRLLDFDGGGSRKPAPAWPPPRPAAQPSVHRGSPGAVPSRPLYEKSLTLLSRGRFNCSHRYFVSLYCRQFAVCYLSFICN